MCEARRGYANLGSRRTAPRADRHEIADIEVLWDGWAWSWGKVIIGKIGKNYLTRAIPPDKTVVPLTLPKQRARSTKVVEGKGSAVEEAVGPAIEMFRLCQLFYAIAKTAEATAGTARE
jgi:hypothetical protein